MPTPSDITELRGRFDLQAQQENEADTRANFIDLVFQLMGWDLHDAQQVRRENKTRAGRPDYIFLEGNKRRFIVEAKAPSENIGGNSHHAIQIRKYAWNSKLPLGILTNFREFAVYDCRAKPSVRDTAATARILYFSAPDELVSDWKKVTDFFSRRAVLAGSLKNLEQSKRGTQRVDEALLEDIEKWRKELAHSIARRNGVSDEDLNMVVQATISRILFLRICEDRGVEPENQLKHLLEGARVYQRLCNLFQLADEKYNSGLFHFRKEAYEHSPPDRISLTLDIDDDTLKGVIGGLYLPHSAYDFSVLPADILGQVYEQFLGREIRLTPSGDARVYFKPSSQKEGGVFYTPTWVVRYIVENTLRNSLSALMLETVRTLRVLDPACGSGSFLIEVYQELLDWYLARYVEMNSSRHSREKRIFRDDTGHWQLTVPERKRILTTHVFGVDIDQQAVEVAKLSLLLKVLEGDANPQRRLFEERAMPDLSDNIKWGDSLIEPDFHQQRTLDGESRSVVFSWEDEFPQVFSNSRRFDVVVGNPPYKGVAGRPGHSANIDELLRAYYKRKYGVDQQFDMYSLFLKRAIQLSQSQVGFIVPDGILVRDQTEPIRREILQEAPPRIIADVGMAFEEAETSNVILVLDKNHRGPATVAQMDQGTVRDSYPVDTRQFLTDPHCKFTISVRPEDVPILSKFRRESVEIQSLYGVSRGEEIGKRNLTGRGTVKILAGEDVGEFRISYSGKVVSQASVKKDWAVYKARKLLVRQTAKTLISAYDRSGFVTIKSVYNLVPREHDEERDWTVCALLNSKLARFVFGKNYGYKLVYPQLNQNWVESFPVRILTDAARERLAPLASEISAILTSSHGEEDVRIQRRVTAIQREIDVLVYNVYGLDASEKARVEAYVDG